MKSKNTKNPLLTIKSSISVLEVRVEQVKIEMLREVVRVEVGVVKLGKSRGWVWVLGLEIWNLGNLWLLAGRFWGFL